MARESTVVRITDDLRQRVQAGEWAPGARLPSRTMLAAAYGVGANILQRAQETLIGEGLLEGRTGSGTYARRPEARRRLYLDRAARFGIRPGGRGPAGSWEIITRTIEPVPERIAHHLGPQPNTAARHTVHVYLAAGRALLLADAWELDRPTGAPGRMKSTVVTELLRPARATRDHTAQLPIRLGSLVTLIMRTRQRPGHPAERVTELVVPTEHWDLARTYDAQSPLDRSSAPRVPACDL